MLQRFGDLWVLAHQVPGPSQRGRRGLVSRHDEGEHFVDHFLIAHGLIRVAVPGGHEHAQKVDMFLRFASPAVYEFRPLVGEGFIYLVDQTTESVDDPAMERWLHHSSLPPPQFALAGHDPVAEEDLDAVHSLPLRIVAMVRQHDAFDVVRMVDDVVVDPARGRENAIRVAEPAEPTAHQRQGFVRAAEIEAFVGTGG